MIDFCEILTLSGDTYYNIPKHPAYFINKSGMVWSVFSKKLVGNYYQFSDRGIIFQISDILQEMFGTSKRENYIATGRKKYKKHGEVFNWKSNLLSKWNVVSGSTYENWGNFIKGKGWNVDLIVSEVNSQLENDHSFKLLDHDSLTFEFPEIGETISGMLSVVFLNWWYSEDLHFWMSAKYKLYEDEQKIFGNILVNVFGDKHPETYKMNKNEDMSDEVLSFKEYHNSNWAIADHTIARNVKKKSNDDYENYIVNYSCFNSYDKIQSGLEEFIYENINENDKKIDARRSTSMKKFNDEMRKLIKLNNHKYPLIDLFLEYSNWFYEDPFNGYKRLDHDLQKLILKEL